MLHSFARFGRTLTASCTAVLLSVVIAGCAAPEKQEELPRTHLWKIEKQGEPTSWVLGTAHVADPRISVISPATDEALTQAKNVATETRLDMAAFIELAQSMTLPADQNLSDKIDADYYGRLVAAMNKRGYPAEAVVRMKPWAVMMLMSTPPAAPQTIPLDMMVAKHALESGKPYDGLEDTAEQIKVFDGMPEDKQILALKNVIDLEPQLAEQTEKLVSAYAQADYATLLALARVEEDPSWSKMSKEDQAWFKNWFERVMIADRNALMAERIAKVLPKGSGFFAIGALHLHGEEGVLKRLRDAGYTVSPVVEAPAK
ncbi:TraB/GumN family protein [Chitinibacteraceae bacterium HSL-7]